MSDSITGSVARLYRAGSEHSQQTEKLRKAVDDLITWMIENIPDDLKPLPCNCTVWRSGDFARNGLNGQSGMGTSIELWRITRGQKHALTELLQFSELIADGFLDELSILLENQSMKFEEASTKLFQFKVGH
jgi:hypothetical protein